MTDFSKLSGQELNEALNFHRRQRNMSRGINEAAHVRQTQMVRMLEAEEARRLNEEKPNKYVIYKHKDKYGVSQDIGTGYNWDHSYHHGYHDTVEAAKAWAVKHAGKYPHKIEVKEEVELSESETNYVIKHKKTKQVLNTHSDYTTAKDEHDGLGADKHEYGIYKQTKKDAALRNRNTYREEVEQIDEISTELKKRYVEKGAQDVVDRFTSRGKYDVPRNPAHFTKTGRVKKSALNRPEAIKYREKLNNRRDIVNKVSQEVHGKKRFGEEVEINEASNNDASGKTPYWHKTTTAVNPGKTPYWHKTTDKKEEVEINEASLLGPEGAIHKQASADQSDREYLKQMAFKNAWKAKNPGKTQKKKKKAGFKEEVEHIEEASDLRITKIYNKWPKKATYAVHNANRSYFKEFDSIEAAKAHHDEKTNNK